MWIVSTGGIVAALPMIILFSLPQTKEKMGGPGSSSYSGSYRIYSLSLHLLPDCIPCEIYIVVNNV